jgi:hypothetical protein
LQDEVSRKEATAQQAKRWLDQAQGQLQNTQTALTVKEAEVKELSAQLDQAAADYARLRVSIYCIQIILNPIMLGTIKKETHLLPLYMLTERLLWCHFYEGLAYRGIFQ